MKPATTCALALARSLLKRPAPDGTFPSTKKGGFMFERLRKRTALKDLTPQKRVTMRDIPTGELRLVTGGALPGPGGKPLCSWTPPDGRDGIFTCDDD
jgi:hypothetical protein